MLSVGDHDFDTPAETVEACVAAVRGGHHHYTQLPGIPALARGDGEDLDARHRRRDDRRRGDRHAGRPGGALRRRAGRARSAATMRSSWRPTTPPIPARSAPPAPDFTVVEAEAEDGFQPRAEAIEKALQPNTRAILHQHAEQPDRRGLFARQPRSASPRSAAEHDLWLLSDEVYWTLGGGEHVSPRALPGMAERTLVINSMSKSHGMTGWRIGWLTGPERHRSRC